MCSSISKKAKSLLSLSQLLNVIEEVSGWKT